jgi:hypothetical protein
MPAVNCLDELFNAMFFYGRGEVFNIKQLKTFQVAEEDNNMNTECFM